MRSVCYERVWPVEEFSANGEQCLNCLCQLRGQAQLLAWSEEVYHRIEPNITEGASFNGYRLLKCALCFFCSLR